LHVAIGWLTVLRMVPWGDVVSNAPKIADGARKLWGAVGRKPPSVDVPAEGEQPSEAQAIATLQARLAAADEAIADLHSQMLASSELIKALAEQNTQLVELAAVNRIRILWLSGATVVLAVVAVAGLVMTLSR
jgi:hypothetical protein